MPLLPALMEASAWETFLAMEASKAIPCSAAATVFAIGALTTRQPNSVAAWRSTLSMPTPALPTTFNFPLAASKTLLVTLVPLLTINASHCEIFSQSASGERSYKHSTLPKLRRIASPASPSFSETRIVGFGVTAWRFRSSWNLETWSSDVSRTVCNEFLMVNEGGVV